eukprot:1121369-Pyramimonas_sp.AAC.1
MAYLRSQTAARPVAAPAADASRPVRDPVRPRQTPSDPPKRLLLIYSSATSDPVRPRLPIYSVRHVVSSATSDPVRPAYLCIRPPSSRLPRQTPSDPPTYAFVRHVIAYTPRRLVCHTSGLVGVLRTSRTGLNTDMRCPRVTFIGGRIEPSKHRQTPP